MVPRGEVYNAGRGYHSESWLLGRGLGRWSLEAVWGPLCWHVRFRGRPEEVPGLAAAMPGTSRG